MNRVSHATAGRRRSLRTHPLAEFPRYGFGMPRSQPRRSPEIEAVITRTLQAIAAADVAPLERLASPDPWFRAIGTDPEEWWDSASFLPIMRIQTAEMGTLGLEMLHTEGWELGDVAWGAARIRVTSAAGAVEMRVTAVYALDAGVWRIVQWHASEGVPNGESLGFTLTTTLTDMLEAIDIDRDFAGIAEGMLTLMFTDVADSTVHAREVGDRAFSDLMAGHVRLVSEIAARHAGTVVKTVGDGTLVVFSSTRAAVAAAVGIQRESAQRQVPYAIRIGLHAGDVVRTDTDVMGLAVNKAARVTSAAAGGQIVVSAVVRELVGRLEGARFGDSFAAELKGLPGLHEIVPIEWLADIAAERGGNPKTG